MASAGGSPARPPDSTHSQAAQVTTAAHDAFISGFATSMKVATGVTAAGVVVAVALIQGRRRSKPETAGARPALEPATGEPAAT